MPELRGRYRYMRFSAEEQALDLKRDLEPRLPDWTLGSAELSNVLDPARHLGWKIEGRLEADLGASLRFDPFPGMESPLALPSSRPETRTERIILDHARTHLATCLFTVPKGYRLQAAQPIARENTFGKVHFAVETVAGTTVKARSASRSASPWRPPRTTRPCGPSWAGWTRLFAVSWSWRRYEDARVLRWPSPWRPRTSPACRNGPRAPPPRLSPKPRRPGPRPGCSSAAQKWPTWGAARCAPGTSGSCGCSAKRASGRPPSPVVPALPALQSDAPLRSLRWQARAEQNTLTLELEDRGKDAFYGWDRVAQGVESSRQGRQQVGEAERPVPQRLMFPARWKTPATSGCQVGEWCGIALKGSGS